MLTPGRIIDSESRLVATVTLIARQRADTGTPRYRGIMAGWRQKWISIVSIISIATIPPDYSIIIAAAHIAMRRGYHTPHTTLGWALKMSPCQLQHGARRGVREANGWQSLVSTHQQQASTRWRQMWCPLLRVKIIIMISIISIIHRHQNNDSLYWTSKVLNNVLNCIFQDSRHKVAHLLAGCLLRWRCDDSKVASSDCQLIPTLLLTSHPNMGSPSDTDLGGVPTEHNARRSTKTR